MRNVIEASRPKMLKLLAAGLLVATALTATTAIVPVATVQAGSTAQAIDVTHGFADLVDKVMPAVVSVEVKFANVASTEEDSQQQAMPDIPENSPFRDFFNQFPQFRNGAPNGQPDAPPRGGMAQGSGFIISADGYAVTNNHVVQNADEVSVKMRDGTEYKAEVVGTDPKTDLALIKIKGDKPFATVKFSEKEPRVGDWVMAVGNPFGLGGTVTTGIISADGRDIGSGPYDNFPADRRLDQQGQLRGPAFNLEGEVVGINTAIFSPSGGSVGIGFAIPASTAETVIDSLKENGKVTRGWLGVQIQPVTEDLAESLGLTAEKGALVADVTEDSPALEAGLKSGDTILKVDGKDVNDPRDLARKVANVKPGETVPVTIIRDGKTMDVDVKIGTMPAEPKMASATGEKPKDESFSLSKLGLKVAPAEDGAGVKITSVDPNGAAAERGLKEGDIILEVAGQDVHEPADVGSALKAADGKKRVLMLVRSGDSQRFIAVPTDAKDKG